MKTLYLSIFSILLVLTACSSKNVGSSVISGNVKIVTAGGNDITRSCRGSVKQGGAFAQNASTGVANLEQITCINGDEVYRIKGDRLSVSISGENSKVDFGSIIITLNDDASYSISGGNGKLQVGDTSKGWSRSIISNGYGH